MNIEAIKKALEALELNNAEWKALADSGDAGYWKAEEQDHYKQAEEAITSLRQAIAEAEKQEPISWRKFNGWMVRNLPGGTIISDPSWWAYHIYHRFIRDTPSPQRNPVTDEQIEDRVLSDVVACLSKQHDWLTKISAINLVAGLYGRADKVLAANGITDGGSA